MKLTSQRTTVLIDAVAASYRSRGYRAFGLTESLSSATALAQDTRQLDECWAAAAWLDQLAGGAIQLDARTLVLVVEGVGTRLVARILAAAKIAEAKVTLVGDFPGQQPAAQTEDEEEHA
jgi:hypothetical protein